MGTVLKCQVDNFGTVVGENPTPYGILASWAVNGLSIVYWDANTRIAFLFANAFISYFPFSVFRREDGNMDWIQIYRL